MMGERQQSRDKTLNQSARFQVLELISMLLVSLGAIIALITQRMVIVAAPLSGSILLNLRNRRKMDQLCHHYTAQGINKIQTSLQQDLRAIRHYLPALDQQNHGSTLMLLRQHLAVLRDKIENLEANQYFSVGSQQFQSLQTKIEQLREETQVCRQKLSLLLSVVNCYSVSWPLYSHLDHLRLPVHPSPVDAKSEPRLQEPHIFQVWLTELMSLKSTVQRLSDQMDECSQPEQSDSQQLARIDRLQDQLSDLYQQVEANQSECSAHLQALHISQHSLQRALHQLHRQLMSLQAETTLSIQMPLLPTVQDITDQIEASLSPLWMKWVALDNQLELLIFEHLLTESQSQKLLMLRKQMLAIDQQVQRMTQVDQVN